MVNLLAVKMIVWMKVILAVRGSLSFRSSNIWLSYILNRWKMIVLIIVTNCYIVDFRYALFVSSHQDCLFLSYCGILMHINSLQHIVALHFFQIQQHLHDCMVLLLFYWDPHDVYQHQGFLYIIIELVLCTIASVNYTLVLTIWGIAWKEP